MLDLTSKSSKSTRALVAPHSGKPQRGPMLSDLRAHVEKRGDLAASTRDKWLRTFDRVGRIMNTPLEQIPASLDLVERRFGPEWTDADEWPTERAYGDFRRIIQSALRKFLGWHNARAELDDREDDWAVLMAAVEPLTKGKLGETTSDPYWHPMKLVGLKGLARAARALDLQPRDLSIETANRIAASLSGNERESAIRALRRFDELFEFDISRDLMPAQQIAFSPEVLAPALGKLPDVWEREIGVWVHAITTNRWDPVSKKYTAEHTKHAKVLKSGLRTVARAALQLGLADRDDDLRTLLSDDDKMTAVAGELFARKDRSKAQGHLEPRSARKYLKGLIQTRDYFAIDTFVLDQILKNNTDSKAGKKAEKSMTAKNRKFCETLLENAVVRRKFFRSHRALQSAAEALLNKAKAEGRDLSKSELAEIRMLGVAACFAAIEIGGAPVRMKNALELTIVGDDAKLRLLTSRKRPIKVHIPSAEVKNVEVIEFEIAPRKYGYYDVIRWYVDVIRPLFPHANQSRYLFPSLRGEVGHMSEKHFRAGFKSRMRSIAGVPMNPHQMRHGQTSLLLDAHPNEIEVIAKRIGDHPSTLRTYYGWLNGLKLVERGQDLLAGLIDG
ncbi:MAG: hypothetical protein HWE26_19620 [Alteromonadaceae bacterium]|nr:hypothetical protein [Alteromonadaceae bacterium]